MEPRADPLSNDAKATQADAAAEQKLDERLTALGVLFTTHTHVPVFTVEEARALRGDLPGVHCKCLFLIDRKGAFYLLVAREEARIDLKGLSQMLGAPRLSFAKPEKLQEILGVRPGAVTPFGLINDANHLVTPLLDIAMLEGELLNYHPLRNDRTTAITPDGLLKFIAGCGHQARCVRLPE